MTCFNINILLVKFYLVRNFFIFFGIKFPTVSYSEQIHSPYPGGTTRTCYRVTKPHLRCVVRGRCRFNLTFFRFNIKKLIICNNSCRIISLFILACSFLNFIYIYYIFFIFYIHLVYILYIFYIYFYGL